MNQDPKQIYTFLGLPAAGKGTQAKIFAQSRGYDLIGMGDLIRDEIENGDKKDPLVADMIERYDKGIVQKDEVVFDLIKKKLEDFRHSGKDGIVLDNFPFTTNQAGFLSDYIATNEFEEPIIINVNIAPETAIKRISSRLICPECNAIYAHGEKRCPKCQTELIHRDDDNEETVRTRIEEYLPHIKKIDNYYRHIGKVVDIDGEKSVEDVTAEINQKL